MLHLLKALVDWVFTRRSSLTLLSLQVPDAGEASRGGRRRLDPPQGPSDPDSRVRAPRWHGPKGRSASIAVAEPADDESVVAIGGHDSGGLGANGDLAAKANRRWTCRSPLSGAWFHSTELATPAASHDRTLCGRASQVIAKLLVTINAVARSFSLITAWPCRRQRYCDVIAGPE
jgi:hypothetical protein